MTYSARTMVDRFASIILPTSAFVAARFEHSIANLHLIPVGKLPSVFNLRGDLFLR